MKGFFYIHDNLNPINYVGKFQELCGADAACNLLKLCVKYVQAQKNNYVQKKGGVFSSEILYLLPFYIQNQTNKLLLTEYISIKVLS